MADLEESIRVGREAVEATPEGHPDRAGYLNSLGAGLHKRYLQTWVMADLEESIIVGREAVEATPEDHRDRAGYLNDLGALLSDRYSRTGAMADLEESIRVGREAVEATPEGYPDRAGYLNNLGAGLHKRSLRTGAMVDLEESIQLRRKAVEATPEGHPDRAGYLNNLAAGLYNRDSRTGAMVDLEESIQLRRKAVEATPEDHPDRAGYLNDLGALLSDRYSRTGAMADLEESIRVGREAVEATPEGHPDRAGYLNNLAAGLYNRDSRTGAMVDLEESIQLRRKAVEATPEDHSDRAGYLNDLGALLSDRYWRTGAMADLEESIRVGREAVEATPEDHPDRTRYLNNLGAGLHKRSLRTGAMADLEESIQVGREAVKATPEDHPDRATRLDNLGAGLHERYSRTGALADLEEFIRLGRAPSVLTPAETTNILTPDHTAGESSSSHDIEMTSVLSWDGDSDSMNESEYTFSELEHSLTKGSTAPTAPSVLNPADITSILAPDHMAGESSSSHDIEIASVLSRDGNSDSTTESDSAFLELRIAAVHYFVQKLTNDKELLGLYQVAVDRVDEARFIRNNNRLLKIYFSDLQITGKTVLQQQAIRFMRPIPQRTRISTEVYRKCSCMGMTLEEKLRNLNGVEEVEAPRWKLNRLLKDQDRTTFDPFLEMREEKCVIETDRGGSTDDSDGDESKNQDDDANGNSITYAELESAAKFLVSGSPLSRYKENLQKFLALKNQSSTFPGTGNDQEDSTKTEDPKQKTFLENDEDIAPSSCSRQQPAVFSNFLLDNVLIAVFITIYNAFVRSSIAITEKFGLYERPLCQGFARLKWNCICGQEFSNDYPESRLHAAQHLQTILVQSGYSAKVYAYRKRNGAIKLPPNFQTQPEASSSDHFQIQATESGSLFKTQPYEGAPSQSNTNLTTGPDSTQLVNEATQETGHGPDSQVNKLPIPTESSRITNQHEFNSEPERHSQRYGGKWLLLCFCLNRHVSRATHLPIEEDTSDIKLVREFKNEYIAMKGRFKYYLNPFRKVTNIKFVRFQLTKDICANYIFQETSILENAHAVGEDAEVNQGIDLALLHDEWPPPQTWRDRSSWEPYPGDSPPDNRLLMHLWENAHHTPVNLAIQNYKVRLRSMAAKLLAHCIRKVECCKQSFKSFWGSVDIPDSKQDFEAGYQLTEIPRELCRLQQEQVVKTAKLRFYVEQTPKKLQRKLKADYNNPPFGWGLFFEEGIVQPKFLKAYLVVAVIILLGILATYLLKLAQESGYAVFTMGNFFVALITAIITLILNK